MARAAPQRAAEQASKAATPPVSSGPLLAARELLRNLPDLAASPEVLRQWCDDVDRLINLAQASPGSMGGSVLCLGSVAVRAAHLALCTPHP